MEGEAAPEAEGQTLLKVTADLKVAGRTLAFSCWLLCAEETLRAPLFCGRGGLSKASGLVCTLPVSENTRAFRVILSCCWSFPGPLGRGGLIGSVGEVCGEGLCTQWTLYVTLVVKGRPVVISLGRASASQ